MSSDAQVLEVAVTMGQARRALSVCPRHLRIALHTREYAEFMGLGAVIPAAAGVGGTEGPGAS